MKLCTFGMIFLSFKNSYSINTNSQNSKWELSQSFMIKLRHFFKILFLLITRNLYEDYNYMLSSLFLQDKVASFYI